MAAEAACRWSSPRRRRHGLRPMAPRGASRSCRRRSGEVAEVLVALCSDKGSPGTTTASVALASCWPSPAAVVEADPYGGDLAIRIRTETGAVLPETPTVLTLATAA